jgi:hypothetical protein
MATLSASADGPCEPGEVWERYARPALWPTWAPQIRRVEVDVERLAAGTSGRVLGPVGASVDFTVDVFDDQARRWAWTVRPRAALLPGVPLPTLRLEHGVDAAGTGTHTWLRVQGPLPLVAGYLPVARLALHRLVH